MLFKNFVAGNFCARRLKYWFINAHNGILNWKLRRNQHKCCTKQNSNHKSLLYYLNRGNLCWEIKHQNTLSTWALGCGRFFFSSNIYEEGWRSSESTRLPQIHQCDPGLNPGVEAICGLIYCWFSLWLQEDFLWVLRLFPFFKNQHFQITIQSGVHRHISMSSKLLSALWINKL